MYSTTHTNILIHRREKLRSKSQLVFKHKNEIKQVQMHNFEDLVSFANCVYKVR